MADNQDTKNANVIPAFAELLTIVLIRNFEAYKFVFTEQPIFVDKSELIYINTPLTPAPLQEFQEDDMLNF